MKAVRVSIALLGVMGAISACGSFLSSPDGETPPVDADAAIDANVPIVPDAPSTEDGGADGSDASPSCKTTALPFEEDFTPPLRTQEWEQATANCDDDNTTYPDRDAGDPSLALGCSSSVIEGYNVINSIAQYPSVARTHVSFAFRIGSTASHVFAQLLHYFGVFGANLGFVATPSNIELWDRKAGARVLFWPAGDQTQWRQIEVDLEPKDGKGAKVALHATLDGDPRTAELTREPNASDDKFIVQLGPYGNVETGKFEDAYDAFRLWSCP